MFLNISKLIGLLTFSIAATGVARAQNSLVAEAFPTLAAGLDFEPRLLDGTLVDFIPHTGPGFGSYLAMALPFEPANSLMEQVERSIGVDLDSRKEAHITIITPPEYHVLQARGVMMDAINALAADAQLQSSEVRAVCLGYASGTKAAGASSVLKRHEVFYVVVESAQLVSLRENVFDLFQANGGTRSEFEPLNFRPHVTLGFVEGDLYESDGAIKDRTSCVAPLRAEGITNARAPVR